MRRGLLWTTFLAGFSALLLGTAACSLQGSPSAAEPSGAAGTASPATPVVLATTNVSPGRGTTLGADNGVSLVVPAGAVRSGAVASITAQGDGTYDVSIDGSWTGPLQVTIPLASADDVVMHEIDGVWLPEGTPGQSTVTVTHLSLFSPSSVLAKLKKITCIQKNVAKLVDCFVAKGLKAVDKKIVEWMMGHEMSDCQAKMLSELDGATSTGQVVLSEIKDIFVGPCVGHAGDPTNWTVPATTPAVPVATGGAVGGGEAQAGSQAVQGSTPGPQGGQAPVPAGSGRIMIDDCLNLRAGPDGGTALVGCIPTDTVITIDCTAQGNSVTGPYGATTIWDHTTYNGTPGYVSDAWVYTGKAAAIAGACAVPARPAPAPAPAASQATGRIMIDDCLNLRAGPNGSTALVGCIPTDTVITIDCTAQGNSVTGPYGATTIWDHTTYNGTPGYVSDAWVYTGKAAAIAGAC